MGKKTVTLVLIVRNEATCLKEVLPKIPFKIFDEVFAIDGNSTDNTREILDQFGVKFYIQKRRGLGAAMIEARQIVSSSSFIYFHPDGNEDPSDLPKMKKLLQDGKSFVVASRMIPGAVNEEDDKLLKFRKWANQGFALIANILFAHGGNRTSDVTNGFRGCQNTTFDDLQLTSEDLTMDFQMIIHALKLGITITEFPTHEYPRVDGITNFQSIPTGIAELKLLFREIFGGLRTVPSLPPKILEMRNE